MRILFPFGGSWSSAREIPRVFGRDEIIGSNWFAEDEGEKGLIIR